MLLVAWVVFHDMSNESFVYFNENHKSMNHLGGMALIGSSSEFYGGERHPGLKRLIDVHV
jgi:hypothetical protein